jgi:hypothetical protein
MGDVGVTCPTCCCPPAPTQATTTSGDLIFRKETAAATAPDPAAQQHQASFTNMQQQLLLRSACSTVLVLLAAAAVCVTAKDAEMQITPNIKMKVKSVSMDDLPKASNPYEGKPYAGCEGGYCASSDFALEVKFWQAADKGDTKAVKKLLGNDALNITRNIVPDSEGFARVVDVAMWAASSKGHVEVMKVGAGVISIITGCIHVTWGVVTYIASDADRPCMSGQWELCRIQPTARSDCASSAGVTV